MSTVAWPASSLPVSKFYGVQFSYADNEANTEYESGRVTSYQKNTRQLRQLSATYSATRAQVKVFDKWFRETLGGTAGRFTMKGLNDNDSGTVTYRFISVPTYSGMNLIDIDISLEEV